MAIQETEPSMQSPESIPVPLPLSEDRAALYLLANNNGKMATLLAFYSFSGHNVTTYRLSKRLHEMTGGTYQAPHTTLLDGYCEDALAPAGLVEYTQPHNKKAYARTGMQLTERGLTLGMGIVGALVPIELKTLTATDETNKRLPLTTALGRTMLTSSGLYGVPSRFALFEHFIENPVISPQDLQRVASVNSPGVIKLTKQLIKLGIISKLDNYGENRAYELQPELALQDPSRTHNPRSQTLVEILMQSQAKGITQLTGKQIVDKVVKRQPAFRRQEIYDIFKRWRFKNKDLLVPVQAKLDSIQYTLNEEYRAFLQEIVTVKQQLVATGEEADTWRQNAWQYAVDLTRDTPQNKQTLALLLSSIMRPVEQLEKPPSKE